MWQKRKSLNPSINLDEINTDEHWNFFLTSLVEDLTDFVQLFIDYGLDVKNELTVLELRNLYIKAVKRTPQALFWHMIKEDFPKSLETPDCLRLSHLDNFLKRRTHRFSHKVYVTDKEKFISQQAEMTTFDYPFQELFLWAVLMGWAKYQNLSFALRPGRGFGDSSSSNANISDGGGSANSSSPADLNHQLHSCVRTGHVETTLQLLALGADPKGYADPETGATPLHVAAREGQELQVELLVLYGADPMTSDFNDQKPSDIAESSGNRELAARLIELQYKLTDRLVVVWKLTDQDTGTSTGRVHQVGSVLNALNSTTALVVCPKLIGEEKYLVAIGLESGEIIFYSWTASEMKFEKLFEIDRNIGHALTVKRLRFRPAAKTDWIPSSDSKSGDNAYLASCQPVGWTEVRTVEVDTFAKCKSAILQTLQKAG